METEVRTQKCGMEVQKHKCGTEVKRLVPRLFLWGRAMPILAYRKGLGSLSVSRSFLVYVTSQGLTEFIVRQEVVVTSLTG